MVGSWPLPTTWLPSSSHCTGFEWRALDNIDPCSAHGTRVTFSGLHHEPTVKGLSSAFRTLSPRYKRLRSAVRILSPRTRVDFSGWHVGVRAPMVQEIAVHSRQCTRHLGRCFLTLLMVLVLCVSAYKPHELIRKHSRT